MRKMWLVCCLSLFSLVIVCRAVPIYRGETSSSEGSSYFSRNDKKFVNESVCIIDDVLYNEGDPIPSQSPCQRCLCEPPEIKCENVKCEVKPGCKVIQRANQCCPEYKCECEKNETVYQNGERLPDDPESPCRACYCQSGEIVCRVLECYRRADCTPREVPGKCCPKYDHCPPVEPTPMSFYTSTSSETINPPSLDYQADMADAPNTSDENIQDNSVDSSRKTEDSLVFGSNTLGDYSDDESSSKPASPVTANENIDNTERLYQDSTELRIHSINITETSSEDDNEKEEPHDITEHSESTGFLETSTEDKKESQMDTTETHSETTVSESNGENSNEDNEKSQEDSTQLQTENREDTTEVAEVETENMPSEDEKESGSITWYGKDISEQNFHNSNSEESSETSDTTTITTSDSTTDTIGSETIKVDSEMLNDDRSNWDIEEDEKATTETETTYKETSTTAVTDESTDEGESVTEHQEISTESPTSAKENSNEEALSLRTWHTNEEYSDSIDANESTNKADTAEKNPSENISNDNAVSEHLIDITDLLRNHSSETTTVTEDTTYSSEESLEHDLTSTTSAPTDSDEDSYIVPVIKMANQLASPGTPDSNTRLSDESEKLTGELHGEEESNNTDENLEDVDTTTISAVTEFTTEYQTTEENSKETYSVKTGDNDYSEEHISTTEQTTSVSEDTTEISTENTELLSRSEEALTKEELTEETGLDKSDETESKEDTSTGTYSTTEQTTVDVDYSSENVNKFSHSQEKILPEGAENRSNSTSQQETSGESSEISARLPEEWLKDGEITTETSIDESTQVSKEENSEEPVVSDSAEDNDSLKSETTTEIISTVSSLEEESIHPNSESEQDYDTSKITSKRYSKTDTETDRSHESSGDGETTETDNHTPVTETTVSEETEGTSSEHEISTTLSYNSYEDETTTTPRHSTENSDETDESAHTFSEEHKTHESGESFNSAPKEHDSFDKSYYDSDVKKPAHYKEVESISPKDVFSTFYSEEFYGSADYLVPSKENYTYVSEESTSRESAQHTEATDATTTTNDDNQSTDDYTTETGATQTSVAHSDETNQKFDSKDYAEDASLSKETTPVPENATQNATHESENTLKSRTPDSFQKSEEMQISSTGVQNSWDVSDYDNSKATKSESAYVHSLRNVQDTFNAEEYEEESGTAE